MKKILTKQEREQMIIESFSKNFNMIKRDEEKTIKKTRVNESLLNEDESKIDRRKVFNMVGRALSKNTVFLKAVADKTPENGGEVPENGGEVPENGGETPENKISEGDNNNPVDSGEVKNYVKKLYQHGVDDIMEHQTLYEEDNVDNTLKNKVGKILQWIGAASLPVGALTAIIPNITSMISPEMLSNAASGDMTSSLISATAVVVVGVILNVAGGAVNKSEEDRGPSMVSGLEEAKTKKVTITEEQRKVLVKAGLLKRNA